MSMDNQKLTIDVERLVQIREILDFSDDTVRAQLRGALLGAIDIDNTLTPIRSIAAREGFEDIGLALASSRTSVWGTLTNPPPGKNHPRWQREYNTRVIERLVSLIGIHQYVAEHKPWTFVDRVIILEASIQNM